MIEQKDEGGHERLLKVINKQKSHHPKNMAPKCHNSIEFVKFTQKKTFFPFLVRSLWSKHRQRQESDAELAQLANSSYSHLL